MSGGSSLPITGGIALGSVVIGQSTIVAAAAAAVVVGAILVKLSFRRGKTAFEK